MLFDDGGRLDLDAHVRRWSGLDVAAADGEASAWIAAAQMFARRLQAECGQLTGEQWQAAVAAWSSLLRAAERATGRLGNEWLLRDLWLRVSLVDSVGPRLASRCSMPDGSWTKP
ncbi:hypothetical protein AB0A69_11920 [Streptomyces sp. NPDC045431]|uniref:hypothetical protein n=1 Tax=Streptomyces sp. NPDC045431 TaxID=3155613 RepID=UPI0033F43BC3